MALASGTKLGPYEIQSHLGAGGMGEVYRATDTKLGRDVALKVLPTEMARDPERLTRFRREAKALARAKNPIMAQVTGRLPALQGMCSTTTPCSAQCTRRGA